MVVLSGKPAELFEARSDYITVGNVSTDCQYKRFSSTDDYFFGTVGI